MPARHPSNPGLINPAPLRQWDGAMPIIMSLVVLLMIAADIWRHGLHSPHHDEGAADHLAMLLMYGQVPIMFWLVAHHPARAVLLTLAIQLSLWAITFASAVALT
jgi:hypothetical protein